MLKRLVVITLFFTLSGCRAVPPTSEPGGQLGDRFFELERSHRFSLFIDQDTDRCFLVGTGDRYQVGRGASLLEWPCS